MEMELDKLSPIDIEKAARFFWVFSDPSRLKIILFLLNSEGKACCVNKIAASLHMNQPAVSQHLRILKEAHLVQVVREKQFLRYSIADKHVEELLSVGFRHIFEDIGERK